MESKQQAIKEAWKPCKGFEAYYEVSDLGNIRSIDRVINASHGKKRIYKGRNLSPYKNKFGYLKVSICNDNEYKTINIHRLIASTFIENPYNKIQVNHINGKKDDNRVCNLEWATREENIQHAHKNGLMNLPNGKDHFLFNINPSLHPRSRSVINIKTNEVYGSIKEAYKFSGVIESTFRGWLRDSSSNEWMYLDKYENNNGWIKIESEFDLPNEDTAVIVMDKNEGIIMSFFYANGDYENMLENCTHYQAVIKPKPPIY